MNRKAAKRLYDVALACQELAHFTEDKTFAEYQTDRALQLVVERLLEIVGEALRRAMQDDTSILISIPDALKIIGMRNRIIHGYDEINPVLVWDAATRYAPGLRTQIETLLADEPFPIPGESGKDDSSHEPTD